MLIFPETTSSIYLRVGLNPIKSVFSSLAKELQEKCKKRSTICGYVLCRCNLFFATFSFLDEKERVDQQVPFLKYERGQSEMHCFKKYSKELLGFFFGFNQKQFFSLVILWRKFKHTHTLTHRAKGRKVQGGNLWL